MRHARLRKRLFEKHFQMAREGEIDHNVLGLFAGGAYIMIPIAAVLRRQAGVVPLIDTPAADVVPKAILDAAGVYHAFLSLLSDFGKPSVIIQQPERYVKQSLTKCHISAFFLCFFSSRQNEKTPRCLRGERNLDYFRCQIRSLYSLIVRSEEKMPEQAVLVIAMRSHFSRFW